MGKKLIEICMKLESRICIKAIRGGLVMIIPIIMVGSFSLLLKEMPITAYYNFITGFGNGVLYYFFSTVNDATFGAVSIYICFSIGYCISREYGGNGRISVIPSLTALCTFFTATGFLSGKYDTVPLGTCGMFIAIICALYSSLAYLKLKDRIGRRMRISEGTDAQLNTAVEAIIPAMLVIIIFYMIQEIICLLLNVANYWELLKLFFSTLIRALGEGFGSSILFVFLENFLWFFGIQGSDALGMVNETIFDPATKANAAALAMGQMPMHMYTKQFFDGFTLIGGVGNTLSLLFAILLFSRNKNNREVVRAAAIPMLFNVNEIMIFGLPIAYNPIMFIPFILVPVTSFLISTAATMLKLVPYTTRFVTWTVPVFWSGYLATGSIRGAVLQLVDLLVGILIYMPFVRIYDEYKEMEAKEELNGLVAVYQEAEEHSRTVDLLETEGSAGNMARLLIRDLRQAVTRDDILTMFYQPQFNSEGHMFGVEALVRWNHPELGFIYPPLIIELGREGGFLDELEKYIFLYVKKDIKKTRDLTFSINITAVTVRDCSFIKFLIDSFGDILNSGRKIYIEITEQSEFITDEIMLDNLRKLKKAGFYLSIDDFSMGHTSLKYLQKGEFDQVKLDGSLARNLMLDDKTEKIIDSIVYLSKMSGFSVLAEYVETEQQKQRLMSLGCNEYQGYLYSPAVPFEKLSELIKADAAV